MLDKVNMYKFWMYIFLLMLLYNISFSYADGKLPPLCNGSDHLCIDGLYGALIKREKYLEEKFKNITNEEFEGLLSNDSEDSRLLRLFVPYMIPDSVQFSRIYDRCWTYYEDLKSELNYENQSLDFLQSDYVHNSAYSWKVCLNAFYKELYSEAKEVLELAKNEFPIHQDPEDSEEYSGSYEKLDTSKFTPQIIDVINYLPNLTGVVEIDLLSKIEKNDYQYYVIDYSGFVKGGCFSRGLCGCGLYNRILWLKLDSYGVVDKFYEDYSNCYFFRRDDESLNPQLQDNLITFGYHESEEIIQYIYDINQPEKGFIKIQK